MKEVRHMDYLITMDTGEQFLAHHGVKGMKWGQWNAETAERYSGGNARMLSKKDLKAAIRQTRRNYKKASGDRSGVMGSNMAKIESRHRKAYDNDEYRNLKKDLDKADKNLREKEDERLLRLESKQVMNEHAQSDRVKEYANKQYEKSSKNLNKALDRYEKASRNYQDNLDKTASKFQKSYKEAALKDMGFKDKKTRAEVQKLIEQYGLERKLLKSGGKLFNSTGYRYIRDI